MACVWAGCTTAAGAPLGGAKGQSTDIQIQAEEILRMRHMLEDEMRERCNICREKSHIPILETKEMKEACERDNFMSPVDAQMFGLIDNVLNKIDKKEGSEK